MRWLRRILGTNFPNPAVGQVWRSEHSGRRMRVTKVETSDYGTVFVTIEHEWPNSTLGWGIGIYYAVGLSEWRWNLRAERRVLEGMRPVTYREPVPRGVPPCADTLAGCAPECGPHNRCIALGVDSPCAEAQPQRNGGVER